MSRFKNDRPLTLFRCPTRGIPKAKITYYKDGNIMKQNPGQVSMDLKTGSLKFSPASTDDSGLYTCTAENEAGLAEYSTQLELHRKFDYMFIPSHGFNMN